MTEPTGAQDAKFRSQFAAARIAALDYGERSYGKPIQLETAGLSTHARSLPEYVYEKNCVLIADEHADTIVNGHLDAELQPGRGAPGVGVYRTGDETAMDAVTRLNKMDSLRGKAAVNHFLSICPVELCPADEPVPLPVDTPPLPYPAQVAHGGANVHVTVVDTGQFTGYEIGHPWLVQGVGGEPQTGNPLLPGSDPLASPDPWPRGLVPEYYGHGVFVAGVLKCAAPDVTIAMINGFPFAGGTMEDMLGLALCNALAADPKPDIISVSAGSMTIDDKSHLGLAPFFSELAKSETLLVAAAGNHGTSQHFWPAAYAKQAPDAVVSVGALRSDGQGRACFSAYGTSDDDWVSVYALGERHVNAFAAGGYAYVDPQRPDLTCRYYPERLYPTCTCVTMPPQGAVVAFRGMAQWSGTSFATPLVAGIIASYMSEHQGVSARDAARVVLTQTDTITDHDIVLHALRTGIRP